ncbi:MAG TPA: hypothetical protein VGR37_24240 [Longimicrobiaceae bacterium]|nr:hypothetical protein [Longimicrobiaceae bacterium]
MNHPLFRTLRRPAALLLAPILALASCDNGPTEPRRPAGTEVAVVVNSSERSLTVVPVDDPAGRFTIGVGAEGSPLTVAVNGGTAVVPLGTFPFAAVVDLGQRKVVHTVALPAGSGATGVAFLNDSIALVANSNLNSVTPVNTRRGTAGAQIPVGTFPQAIVASEGRAYVLNAELEKFVPVRPGSISVIDGTLKTVATIQLSGLNPGAAAFGPGGQLYVVNSGSFGGNNGSLSVVDVNTRRETSHHPGFGNFPGSVAVGRDGLVHVGVYGEGVRVWDPATRLFRGLNPIVPGGKPPVSGIGFDFAGRLHTLNPGSCKDPGTLYRLGSTFQVEQQTSTGICPFGLAFTFLP